MQKRSITFCLDGMKNLLNKSKSRKITLWILGFFLILNPGWIKAEENSPVLSSYYSKDPRASSPEISSQQAQDKIVMETSSQSYGEKSLKESPLHVIDSIDEVKENYLTISFSDLHFDSALSAKGEVKLSDHESLLFQNDSVIAHAYGNQVSLNLEDQKLLCVSFSGYVLGPFIPSQDYLGIYFETIDSLKALVDKSRNLEKKKEAKDETYLQALSQAKNTLDEFLKRTKKIREETAKEDLKTRIKDAIHRYYEGDIPDHQSLIFQEIKENEKSHWEAVMTFVSNREIGKIKNRTFIFHVIRDDFAVVEIQDRDAEGRALLKETLDYDSDFVIKDHRIKAFYLNGVVKTDHDLRYEDGIKSTRYYREFNETGNRLRFLSETFYQDGNTKTSSDYQYQSGKKFFYTFNSDGRVIYSSSEPLSTRLS